MAAVGNVTVDVSVDGQRLRVEALDFAIRTMEDETPGAVVARANTYYEFLKDGTTAFISDGKP